MRENMHLIVLMMKYPTVVADENFSRFNYEKKNDNVKTALDVKFVK